MKTVEGMAWHALAETKGAGPQTLWRIGEWLAIRNRSASWLLQNPAEIGNIFGIQAPESATTVAKRVFPGTTPTLLHPLHSLFPRRVKERRETMPLPALLYAVGNLALLARPAVAIVGSRRAGPEALAVADALASALAVRGVVVTSGYAAGIDTAAHRAALRGKGTTCMVLSEGIARFTAKPELRECLTGENSLVLSQFAPDARWAGYMAMTRNKLVCALCDAVVVIVSGPERDAGGRMSGSFDAGLAALKMGIPAFAVAPALLPGSPAGNRDLIARGLHAWDPASGPTPILEAVREAEKRGQPGQLELFTS